jgi:hypothetical protein
MAEDRASTHPQAAGSGPFGILVPFGTLVMSSLRGGG